MVTQIDLEDAVTISGRALDDALDARRHSVTSLIGWSIITGLACSEFGKHGLWVLVAVVASAAKVFVDGVRLIAARAENGRAIAALRKAERESGTRLIDARLASDVFSRSGAVKPRGAA